GVWTLVGHGGTGATWMPVPSTHKPTLPGCVSAGRVGRKSGLRAVSRCFSPVMVVEPDVIVNVALNESSGPVASPYEPWRNSPGGSGMTGPFCGPMTAVAVSV